MSFVPTPGYTYVQPTQEQKRKQRRWIREHPREYREYMSKRGKPLAQKEYLEQVVYKEEIEVQKQQATEQWKQQIRQQYPASLYDVRFVGGEAQITPRQVSSQGRPTVVSQRVSQLEAEAQAARSQVRRGTWTQPQYQAVTKRQPSIAEYDVPHDIQLSKSPKPSAPALFMEHYREVIEPREKGLFMKHYEEVMVPKEIERGWHAPEGGYESRHWVTPEEFEKRYGVIPNLPKTAKITYMQRTKKGYELQYFTPRGPPKTFTELFERAIIGTDVPIFGGPVGGVLGMQSLGFQIKTWEATVGEVEEHVFKQPTARSELMAPSELLLAHGIFATVATVKFGPKVIKSVSGTRVGQAIKFSRTAKAVETFKTTIKSKLPSWKGSRPDVWLAKKSKLYYEKTRGITPSEVGLKPFETVTKRGETLPKIGLADIEATNIYWKLIQAPRTGGVMIGKAGLASKGLQTYTFEWVMKAGQLVPRFRPERAEPYTPTSETRRSIVQMYKPEKMGPYTPIYERGLTPFASQQQLTRMGIHPYSYVGGKTTAVGSSFLSSLSTGIGLAITPRVKFQQKPMFSEWQPTHAFQREKLRMLTFELPRQKQRKTVIPMLKLRQLQRQKVASKLRLKSLQQPSLSLEQVTEPSLIQKQAQKQEAIPALMPRQLQRQYVAIPKPPELTPPTTIPPTTPYIPRFKEPDLSKELRGLRGRWFKRTHAIKEPKELLRSFQGKPKRRRAKGGAFPWG